jgi:MarR family transcriptional regulator, 2-MHQ and catechol-resistance regulon repressor
VNHPGHDCRRVYLDNKYLDVKIVVVANTSGTHLWLVLMKAHRSLARHARRSIEGLDLCFSDFAILELLLHQGAQPVNTIGRRIELTTGSITTAIDRLETRGLVVRGLDENDRRIRIVSLTPEGTQRITAAFAQHKRWMDRAASGLSAEERAVLINLTKKLGKTADQLLETNP